MKDKSKTSRFPEKLTESDALYDDENESFDIEEWESYQEFHDNKDFPGLVQFCKKRVKQNPDDMNAQSYLGDAYVLNGEYKRAIKFMSEHHRKYSWNGNYQYVILDALFALGKTEDDFDWIERPVILRISPGIIDTCYEFLRPKRNPRSINEIHVEFIPKGYLLFTKYDLLNALKADERFIVESPYKDSFSTQIRAC